MVIKTGIIKSTDTDDSIIATEDILKPTEDILKPSEDLLKPTEDLLKPTKDLLKPTEDNLKPIEDNLKPIEDNLKPIEDILKPTDELRKATEEMELLDEEAKKTKRMLCEANDTRRKAYGKRQKAIMNYKKNYDKYRKACIKRKKSIVECEKAISECNCLEEDLDIVNELYEKAIVNVNRLNVHFFTNQHEHQVKMIKEINIDLQLATEKSDILDEKIKEIKLKIYGNFGKYKYNTLCIFGKEVKTLELEHNDLDDIINLLELKLLAGITHQYNLEHYILKLILIGKLNCEKDLGRQLQTLINARDWLDKKIIANEDIGIIKKANVRFDMIAVRIFDIEMKHLWRMHRVLDSMVVTTKEKIDSMQVNRHAIRFPLRR
jgi:hypothetical protein